MVKTEKPRNYLRFRLPRNRAIRTLNNIFVINTIARRSLQEARTNLCSDRVKRLNFEVPTVSGETITFAKRKSQVLSLLDEAIDRDLYSQSLITAVAVTESYLVTSLRTILTWFPEKLSAGQKKIDFSLVLESDDLDEVILRVVQRQVDSVFYASPRKYLEYMEEAFAFEIPQKVKEQYAEVKATRDILVHNSGKVNDSYLSKAGDRARAEEGELIPLDSEYFDESIRAMKTLVTRVCTRLLKKYGNVRR